VPSEFALNHLPPTSHALVGEDRSAYVRELEPHADALFDLVLSSHPLRRKRREECETARRSRRALNSLVAV